ncbi:MAG: hypothetical protein AB7D51_01980 [Desulfovibrionaceae bacterium]
MELYPSLFRFSLLLLFVPVLLFSAMGAALTLHGMTRRRALAAWPLARARVLSTSVEVREYRGALGSRERAWDLEIEYEYEARGGLWRGSASREVELPRSVRRSPEAHGEALDQAVARAREAIGGGLAVHVDPAAPARSLAPLPGGRGARLRLALFSACALVSAVVLGYVFGS